MHTGLRALRAKVRGFQAEGQTLAKRIQRASGAKRAALWNEKRRLGVYTRLYLVAYGLLRGTPYAQIEAHAKEKLEPKSVFVTMRDHADYITWKSLSEENVAALLDQPRSRQENGGEGQ